MAKSKGNARGVNVVPPVVPTAPGIGISTSVLALRMRRSWVRIPQGAPHLNPWNCNGSGGFLLQLHFQFLGKTMGKKGQKGRVNVVPPVVPLIVRNLLQMKRRIPVRR